jgi:hypothetical protein
MGIIIQGASSHCACVFMAFAGRDLSKLSFSLTISEDRQTSVLPNDLNLFLFVHEELALTETN